MNEFNLRFEGLSEAQKQERYQRLASACLAHYPIGECQIRFIQHNAGITYRVEMPDDTQPLLLKIAQFIGDDPGRVNPGAVQAGFMWLDALARETPLVVQRPVMNSNQEFLTSVSFDDLPEPFYCTLQHWVAGEHPRNPTVEQAYHIGKMTALLHEHGRQWLEGKTPEAYRYDEVSLQKAYDKFSKVRMLSILSDAEFETVTSAFETIMTLMQALGKALPVWGPIHGDLHHQNIVIHEEDYRAIDFGGLTLGHYAYDLSVTLYHFMYLPASVRKSLIAGYTTKRSLDDLPPLSLEAFLCAAALGNLAFNVHLPDQRTTPLFIKNVREFATIFCGNLVKQIPFVLV